MAIQGKRGSPKKNGRCIRKRPFQETFRSLGNYAFFLSSFFFSGLHFSQTFLSLVAVTQQGCEQAFAAAMALSQQEASAWHLSQTFFSLCAATQHGCAQSLPPALALTQQLSAIAPLVLSRKAAAQTVAVNVLMNFIVFPLSSARRF
jgi:hypothetical protein